MNNASAISAAVREGSTSAQAVVEAALDQIAQRDPQLNAFSAVFTDRARAEARAVDLRRERGEPLGPLAGVPYSVKNLFDVEGVVTLAGAKVKRADAPARKDAVLVSRMRAAGAVLVGAVNMDENAYGFTTENSHFGVTRNPLDQARLAGGSSGGSAASVAAGMACLSLGSDTNGSIRVPSSFCGTFGFKPTYGRLPRTGTYPFVHGLDHLGPFAMHVQDLALAYDALQGFDAGDPACVMRALEPTVDGLDMARLRVGVLGGYFEDFASPEARAVVARAAQALGANTTVLWSSAGQARAAAFIMTGSEGGALHKTKLQQHYEEYEPLSRDRLVAGSLIPAEWYLGAQKWRALCRAEMLALFRSFDILLAPATPFAAPLIGTEWIELNGQRLPARASIGLLTQPVSCIGLPVCAVPVFPEQGAALPIAVQLIGAPWQEGHCLAAARMLERAGMTSARTVLEPTL